MTYQQTRKSFRKHFGIGTRPCNVRPRSRARAALTGALRATINFQRQFGSRCFNISAIRRRCLGARSRTRFAQCHAARKVARAMALAGNIAAIWAVSNGAMTTYSKAISQRSCCCLPRARRFAHRTNPARLRWNPTVPTRRRCATKQSQHAKIQTGFMNQTTTHALATPHTLTCSCDPPAAEAIYRRTYATKRNTARTHEEQRRHAEPFPRSICKPPIRSSPRAYHDKRLWRRRWIPLTTTGRLPPRE